MKILEYIKEDGSNPYKKWFDTLNAQAAAKVTVAKARIELGNTSNIKWFDGIGEYRIDWGPGYRIYLIQDGFELIILLGGGSKKRQQQDIKKAKALYKGMSITRDYKDTINERVVDDPLFTAALLDEAITLFLNGEPDVARLVLRDLVNATLGFEELATEIERPSKSLHRMLSARGNPTMDNLTKIICILRDRLGLDINVHATPKCVTR